MRLVITLVLVILSAAAGWHYYPELYKAISGKEAPLKKVEEPEKEKAATAPEQPEAEK